MAVVESNFSSVLETSDLLTACRAAAPLSRKELMQIAVFRGCDHYAPLVESSNSRNQFLSKALPHEVLGTALLRGRRDSATFQAIRCGAMVLSDLSNSPETVVAAAHFFGVANRVAHIARLGMEFDHHPEFWRILLSQLPVPSDEDGFLPGVSRFTLETRMTRMGRQLLRVWLRTQWRR